MKRDEQQRKVFDEMIQELNSLEITQKRIDWEENIPDDIWQKYFLDEIEYLDEDVEIEKHRWYETSVSVVSLGEFLLGIKHVNVLYSETMTTEDCFHTLSFFEMKEVKSITYIRK